MRDNQKSVAIKKFCFDELFRPVSGDAFLRDFWGSQPLYAPGKNGRFEQLLSWRALNKLLASHRLDHPRIRLAKDGCILDPSQFLRHVRSGRGGLVPRVDPKMLHELLRDGATLVVDDIDELADGVLVVAEEIERRVQEYAQANLYVSWSDTKGFTTHWDNHDVIVLQVHGSKTWRVFRPQEVAPLPGAVGPAPQPNEQPSLSVTLDSGDALYIPRGWWHDAQASGGPSMHLTYGVTKTTGMDFAASLLEQLRSHSEMRMDLPRFASPEQFAAHESRLKQIICDVVGRSRLGEFIDATDARCGLRRRPSLPWAITPSMYPLTEEHIVSWAPTRTLAFESTESGEVTEVAGKRYTFTTSARAILDQMASLGATSIGDLHGVIGKGTMDFESLTEFVLALADEGLATVDLP